MGVLCGLIPKMYMIPVVSIPQNFAVPTVLIPKSPVILCGSEAVLILVLNHIDLKVPKSLTNRVLKNCLKQK